MTLQISRQYTRYILNSTSVETHASHNLLTMLLRSFYLGRSKLKAYLNTAIHYINTVRRHLTNEMSSTVLKHHMFIIGSVRAEIRLIPQTLL